MTHFEFIAKVNANHSHENVKARKWLKNVTRLQLQSSDGRTSNPTPIFLITNRKSVLDESISDDCVKKINLGIRNILDCYPTFESYLSKDIKNSSDLKEVFERIFRVTQTKPRVFIPASDINKILDDFIQQGLLKIIGSTKNIEIGKFIEEILTQLEKFKIICERENRINDIVYQTNTEEFRYVLSSFYKIEDKYLPSEYANEELAYLGLYKHSGQIYLYLDVIYDNAISLGLDPYLLYRKVLIHELAHAFHHRGLDAKNEIWENFSYPEPSRLFVIEGLAQWYAMQYMIYLDSEEKDNGGFNLLTIVWMSLFQKSQYRHYLNWVRYSSENVRRTIIEARAKTGTLERSSDFDRELELNHSKNL
jgi:hypothetical protein